MHTKRMKCTMIMLGCLFTAFFLSACSNGRYTYELEGGEQTKVMQESGDGQGGADQSAKESLVQAKLTGRRKQLILEKRFMSRSMVR